MSSGIDLVIITLICSKQKKLLSKRSVGGRGHRLVCCCACQSVPEYGKESVHDGIYLDGGLTFRFANRERSGSSPKTNTISEFPSPTSFFVFVNIFKPFSFLCPLPSVFKTSVFFYLVNYPL